MIDLVLASCRESWAAWFPDEPTPALSAVAMTRGRLDDRSLVLVLADRTPHPRLAVKVVWSPASIAAVEQEAAALRCLPAHFPGIPARVPRHLATLSFPHGAGMVTTFVPGARWRVATHRWRRSPGVRTFLARCAEVVDATSCGMTTDGAARPLSAMAPTVRWGAARMRGGPATSLGRLAQVIASTDDPVVRGWQHGDLALGNVLLADGTTPGIVDWEMAREDLPAWFDACYVPCALALDLGPDHQLVRWVVREVVAPRWQAGFPLVWGLSLTALVSARRAERQHRGAYERWLDVASGMLELRTPREES